MQETNIMKKLNRTWLYYSSLDMRPEEHLIKQSSSSSEIKISPSAYDAQQYCLSDYLKYSPYQ